MSNTNTPETLDSRNAIQWGHDLWKTRDAGKPSQILDRNGEVALDLCKRCGKAEAELSADNCTPAKREASSENENPLVGPVCLAY